MKKAFSSLTLLLLLTLTFAVAGPSRAQTYNSDDNNYNPDAYADMSPAVGARAGFGLNPDQFAFGVQSILGGIFNTQSSLINSLELAPSIDVGLGSSLLTVSLNPDLRATLFGAPGSNLDFYGKIGPGIVFAKPDNGGTDTQVGLNLSAGITMPMTSHRNMYNLEARFGIGDIPDFRLLFGVQFGINSGNNVNAGTVSR